MNTQKIAERKFYPNGTGARLNRGWFSVNGWKQEYRKKSYSGWQAKNCLIYTKQIGNRLYEVSRKYNKIKYKWTIQNENKPCCQSNKGIYWDVIYFDTWYSFENHTKTQNQ
ncbi:MAG TPA: hypothetical protein VMV56_02855 [Williamwhitmania sp.]|nr:hypothetical protein [Williamwhitmania sp.]